MLTGFDLLVAKSLYLFTDDFVAVFNLRFLMIFPISSMIAYGVLRKLDLNFVFSSFGAVVYSLSPYIFYRNVAHLSLSTCYFIPLSILLCVWAVKKDESFLRFDKSFFKKKEHWLAILFCALIANNGIGYYPFFTCFFLCVVAVCNLFAADKSEKLKSVLIPAKLICGVVGFMVIALAPSLIYSMIVGGNFGAVVRGGADAELYSLKIVQMLLPIDGNGIEILDYIIGSYNSIMPLVNENISAYLGIAGVCGFLIAGVLVFRIKNDENDDRTVAVMVRMIVFGVLFATIGGFSSIFGSIVSFIRGFNRISIFILFISLCILLIILQKAWDKIKEKVKWKKVCAIAAFSLFGIVCLWDLIPIYGSTDWYFEVNGANYSSDKEFVEQIEAELGEGASVYQLPYHKCPEGGNQNNMADYHLYTGFINSDTLKWSYGGTKGRDADLWCRYAASLETDEMLTFIAKGGFTGLYIDTRAYTPESLATLRAGVEATLGTQPKISANGNLMFYDLRPFMTANSIVYDESVYDMDFIKTRSVYTVADLHVSGNGEKKDGKIVLDNNSNQFGPYTHVEKGEYLIAFYGENLSGAVFSLVYDYGRGSVELTEVERTEELVILKAVIAEDISAAEFRTFNGTDQVMAVSCIRTVRLSEAEQNTAPNVISEFKNKRS